MASTPPVNGSDVGYSVRKKTLTATELETTVNDLKAQAKPLIGFHVTGPCPGCTHRTSDVFPAAAIVMDAGAGVLGEAATRASASIAQEEIRPDIATSAGTPEITARRPVGNVDKPKIAMLHCRCAVTHDNSSGKDGCGATWLVKACFDNRDPVRGADLEALTQAEEVAAWPVAEVMASSSATALTTVQAAAAKWQTALTSILALVTVVSLVGGRTALETIDHPYRWVIAGFAVVAVLANAWAVYRSTLSSIGFPRIRQAAGTPELIASDLWPLRQATDATEKLHAAVFWAACSFISAIIAVGFVWMSPDVQPSAVTLTLTGNTQGVTSVCGSLQTSTPSTSKIPNVDQISLRLKDGTVMTYPLTSVKSISPGGC